MAEWKRILVEGDAVANNLATANLVQSSTPRTYDVGSSQVLNFEDGTVNFKNSSSETKIQISANSTNVIALLAGGALQFSDSDNTNNCTIDVPSNITSNYTITLPSAGPGGTKILQSDVNGDLSWIDTPSGGGGGVTVANQADNYVVTATGTTDALNAEANMTFNGSQLDVTGRIVATDFITLDTNNKSLKGQTTGALARDLIKCNASNETEVGNSSEKTVLNGTSVDASALQFSCGPATMDEIVATNISLSSTGDYGEGSVVTYFDTSSLNSTTVGRVYYYTGTAWAFATSSAEAGNKALVGVALGSDESAGFLLQGFVNPGITMTAGSQCFLATNASITNTVPTSGFSRVMGHSVTTTVMYFNPSADYIDL